MRFPYLQIAMEVLEQYAPDLAAALDWNEDAAFAGLCRLFRWALARCPDDRPPSASAVVEGPGAALLVAKVVRWPGEPARLIEALGALRPAPVVEVVGGDLRVCGLKRYDRGWRKSNPTKAREWDAPGCRKGAGKVPDPAPNSAGKVPEPAPQIQTQTQRTTSPPAREAPTAKVLHPQPPGPPLVDALNEVHFAKRKRVLWWGRPSVVVASQRAVGDLAAEHGEVEALRRLGNALTVPKGEFPYLAEGGDLARHWGHYADPFDKSTTQRNGAPRSAASAADRDWSTE